VALANLTYLLWAFNDQSLVYSRFGHHLNINFDLKINRLMKRMVLNLEFFYCEPDFLCIFSLPLLYAGNMLCGIGYGCAYTPPIQVIVLYSTHNATNTSVGTEPYTPLIQMIAQYGNLHATNTDES
jgi:hypothetical protein